MNNEFIFQRVQEVLSIAYKTFKNAVVNDIKMYNDACDMFIELIQFMDNFKNENK